jgi:hypothetical protein
MIPIVCPSKGRAERLHTKKYFEHLIVVVTKGEGDEYKNHNPEVEVVETPEHIRGITPTRQFILENWDNPFMIDDDVVSIRKNFAEPGDDDLVRDRQTVHEIIEETAYMCKEIGAYVYGFSKMRNPLEFRSHIPIVHTGFMNGSFKGFIKGHGLSYDVTLKEAEDHYMSCLSIYKHRYNLINNFYSFVTEVNFEAAGGCNDYRTIEMMKQNTLRLREMFGEVVNVKHSTKIKKKVHQGERSLSFPY